MIVDLLIASVLACSLEDIGAWLQPLMEVVFAAIHLPAISSHSYYLQWDRRLIIIDVSAPMATRSHELQMILARADASLRLLPARDPQAVPPLLRALVRHVSQPGMPSSRRGRLMLVFGSRRTRLRRPRCSPGRSPPLRRPRLPVHPRNFFLERFSPARGLTAHYAGAAAALQCVPQLSGVRAGRLLERLIASATAVRILRAANVGLSSTSRPDSVDAPENERQQIAPGRRLGPD